MTRITFVGKADLTCFPAEEALQVLTPVLTLCTTLMETSTLPNPFSLFAIYWFSKSNWGLLIINDFFHCFSFSDQLLSSMLLWKPAMFNLLFFSHGNTKNNNFIELLSVLQCPFLSLNNLKGVFWSVHAFFWVSLLKPALWAPAPFFFFIRFWFRIDHTITC